MAALRAEDAVNAQTQSTFDPRAGAAVQFAHSSIFALNPWLRVAGHPSGDEPADNTT